MPFIETTFQLSPEDDADILIAILSEAGYDSFEETGGTLKAYIDESDYSDVIVAETLATTPLFNNIAFTSRQMEQVNWNTVWEQNYEPIMVAEQVYIRADFHPATVNYPYELLINPKMSFGTGHHATTSMMVEMMLGDDYKGKSTLDFGSGTGILAILAEKMGALNITAIDHEEWAYLNCIENISVNDCTDIEVKQGSVEVIPNRLFDFVLANVNKNVILDNLSKLIDTTTAGGFLYLSGLLISDEEVITTKAAKLGCQLIKRLEQRQWICLKLMKSP